MKRWTQRTWIKIIAVALSLSLIAAAVALVLSRDRGVLDRMGRDGVTALFPPGGHRHRLGGAGALFPGGGGPSGTEASRGGRVAQLRPGAGGPGLAGPYCRSGPAGLAGDRPGPHPHPTWVIARTPATGREVTRTRGRPRASSPASAWWTEGLVGAG